VRSALRGFEHGLGAVPSPDEVKQLQEAAAVYRKPWALATLSSSCKERSFWLDRLLAIELQESRRPTITEESERSEEKVSAPVRRSTARYLCPANLKTNSPRTAGIEQSAAGTATLSPEPA